MAGILLCLVSCLGQLFGGPSQSLCVRSRFHSSTHGAHHMWALPPLCVPSLVCGHLGCFQVLTIMKTDLNWETFISNWKFFYVIMGKLCVSIMLTALLTKNGDKMFPFSFPDTEESRQKW